MIQPETLLRKAENLYPEFLCSWLEGENFFPRTVPTDRKLDPSDHAGAISLLQRLRDGSKESRGFGYSIEWRERKSRDFGRNPFPERFYFETQEDFLRFIDRRSEFAAFVTAVNRLRAEFPELEGWICSHRRLVIDIEPSLDGLMQLLRYFRSNPRPNRFARELPVQVDTKFLQRHEQVLRDWLDLILPPDSIRSSETHFARRFGLLYPEMHVIIRFLDPQLQQEASCPWPELSLPISALAMLPIVNSEVIIVENKVNLLTLPQRPRTLGLGALGRAVSELRHIPWLATIPVRYWGDLDIEGFEILSALRAEFPHVQSLLMDETTVKRFRSLSVPGTGRQLTPPPFLTHEERLAFTYCLNENIRVEQERIPLEVLLQTVNGQW